MILSGQPGCCRSVLRSGARVLYRRPTTSQEAAAATGRGTAMDVERFLDAVRGGDASQVEALLAEHPALIAARNDSGVSPLLLAAYYGQATVAAVLQRHAPVLD